MHTQSRNIFSGSEPHLLDLCCTPFKLKDMAGGIRSTPIIFYAPDSQTEVVLLLRSRFDYDNMMPLLGILM